MENTDLKFALKSTPGLPYNFVVRVQQSGPECLFEITGSMPVNHGEKTCLYKLDDRKHDSYLNFFEKLSSDFGLRIPQNRRLTAVKPPSHTKYKEVLTKNLSSDILYGYGDPAVVRVDKDGTTLFYLVATSNDAPNSFPILRSTNLIDWELVNFVFPKGKKPEWAANGEFISDYWAPEMHQVGNEFRIYFVARDKISHELCIGVARSSHPEGPFIANKEAILKGNVIDPHIYVEDKETTYLFWKEDNNDVWPGRLIELLHHNPELITSLFDEQEDRLTVAFILTLWPWIKTLEPMERFLAIQVLIEAIISRFTSFCIRLHALQTSQPVYVQEQIQSVLSYMRTPMYAQPLSADGSSLIGKRTKIIENDLEWEAHLVEGMWVTKHQDNYYLFYAGNDFSTDQYGIGVAYAKSLLGPYTKLQKPFLQSTEKWWAPGHPSIVTGLDGIPQLFLHAYFPRKAGYKEFRALLSVPLIFEKEGVLAERP